MTLPKDELEFIQATNELSKESAQVHIEADHQEFPEGGRGWLVICGCLCNSTMSFGMINAYSVFQTHYETVLFPEVASMKLSIIGALQACVTYLTCSLALPIVFAFGLRNALTMATSLMVIAVFGLSTTTEGQLWKCYLFQSVMFAIGSGFMFCTLLFTSIEWFKKRRALALGFASSGVSFGGVIWPLIFKRLIKDHSFAETVRAIGYVYIPLAVGCVAFVPQSLPPQFVHKDQTVSNSKWSNAKIRCLPKTYFNLFKSWIAQTEDIRYDSLLISNALGMLSVYPAIFYLDYFATLISPNSLITEYLVVIYNAFGGPGRIFPGFVGDYIGRCNALIICLVMVSISILAMWIPSIKDEIIGLYAVFVCVFGFFVAPFFSLYPACFTQIFGTHGSEARLGFFLLTSAPGPLLGCVIAGSFIPKGTSTTEVIVHAFYKLTIFSGVVMLASCGLLLAVRLSITAKPFSFV